MSDDMHPGRRLVGHLCLCGRSDARTFLRAMLERAEAIRGPRGGPEPPYDPAAPHVSLGTEMDVYGDRAPGAWVEFCAHLLGAADLLEHGGSIGGAWLTDEGTRVLAWLRAGGEDLAEDTCPCGHEPAEHQDAEPGEPANRCRVLGCEGCPPARGLSYVEWLEAGQPS